MKIGTIKSKMLSFKSFIVISSVFNEVLFSKSMNLPLKSDSEDEEGIIGLLYF